MGRVLRRELETLRLHHRGADDERLHHALDPARERSVNDTNSFARPKCRANSSRPSLFRREICTHLVSLSEPDV